MKTLISWRALLLHGAIPNEPEWPSRNGEQCRVEGLGVLLVIFVFLVLFVFCG